MKGHISISRWTSSSEPEGGVSITLEDELSGTTFVQVKMPLKAFADALMGRGYVPMEFSLATDLKVGKTREHDMVDVITGALPKTNAEIDRLILGNGLDLDGWHPYRSDFTNHHRITYLEGKKQWKIQVHRERWV